MNKAGRYAAAFVACLVIFFIWVAFQMYVAGGVLVGVIFCGIIFATWKFIVNYGKDEGDGESMQNPETRADETKTQSEKHEDDEK